MRSADSRPLRDLRFIVLLAASVALLAACSPGGNGQRSGTQDGGLPSVPQGQPAQTAADLVSPGRSGAVLASPGSLPDGVGVPRVLWRTPGPGPVVVPPVVADDTVIAGYADYSIRGLAAATGEERWRVERNALPIASAVAASGVFVADLQSVSRIAPEDGSTLWSYETPLVPGAGILATTAAVYVPGAGGSMRALSPDTGGVQWTAIPEAGASSDADTGSPVGAPVALDGVVYTVTSVGYALAYRAGDGTPLFRTRTGTVPASGPVVTLDGLFVTGTDGAFVILARTDGRVIARGVAEEPLLVAGVPAGDRVFIAGAAGGIYRTGWAGGAVQPAGRLDADTAGQPALLDSHVLAADARGGLHLLPVSGVGEQRGASLGARPVGQFSFDGETAYVGTAEGQIAAIRFDGEGDEAPLLGAERWWTMPPGGAFRMAARTVELRFEAERTEVREWAVSSSDPGDQLIVTVADASGSVVATNMGKVELAPTVRVALRAGQSYRLRVERPHVNDQAVITLRSRTIQ